MLKTTINFKRLTEARHEHGLSVSELSIITGLTERQINQLENGKDENAFVEHEHRIDCVKRVAEALAVNYDRFLSSAEYVFSGQDMSGAKKNEEKFDKEDQVNEFNELKKEIAKFRISKVGDSEYSGDNQMEERKKVSGNLRHAESLGPIVLVCLFVFFYLLNFV